MNSPEPEPGLEPGRLSGPGRLSILLGLLLWVMAWGVYRSTLGTPDIFGITIVVIASIGFALVAIGTHVGFRHRLRQPR